MKQQNEVKRKIKWSCSCYKPQNVEELIEQHNLHADLEATAQSEERRAVHGQFLADPHR